jgi:tetratricopeptide (TPR) repeat protein
MYQPAHRTFFRIRSLVLTPILLLVAASAFAGPVKSRESGEALLAAKPAEASSYLQYAEYLMDVGAYKDAAIVLENGCKLAPASADLLVRLGEIYSARGLDAHAESVTREALKVDPEHVVAHLRMGEIYFRQGWNKSGLTSFRQAVELAPDDQEPKVQLVIGLCEDKQFAAAENQCLEFISSHSQSPDLWLSLGEVFEKQNKQQQAFTTYGQVLTIDPENSQAYARQGRLFCQFGQFHSAVSVCQRALELEPDNALGHAYLGIACAKLGRNDEARRHAEIAENGGLNMVSVWKIIEN